MNKQPAYYTISKRGLSVVCGRAADVHSRLMLKKVKVIGVCGIDDRLTV